MTRIINMLPCLWRFYTPSKSLIWQGQPQFFSFNQSSSNIPINYKDASIVATHGELYSICPLLRTLLWETHRGYPGSRSPEHRSTSWIPAQGFWRFQTAPCPGTESRPPGRVQNNRQWEHNSKQNNKALNYENDASTRLPLPLGGSGIAKHNTSTSTSSSEGMPRGEGSGSASQPKQHNMCQSPVMHQLPAVSGNPVTSNLSASFGSMCTLSTCLTIACWCVSFLPQDVLLSFIFSWVVLKIDAQLKLLCLCSSEDLLNPDDLCMEACNSYWQYYQYM